MAHCEMQSTNRMVTQLLRRSIQYFIDGLDEGMDCAFIKSAKIKSVRVAANTWGRAARKTFDNLDKSINTGGW